MLRRGIVLIPVVFIGVFFAYPLVQILVESLTSDGVSFAPFGDILGDDFFLERIWFTLWQAAASTALTLLLGLPSAYIFARYDFPGKTLIKALTTVPFVMPTIVVAFGFLALIGPNGILPFNLTNSIWIILLAHVFYNYTIVVRTVSALWANVDPRTEEAARMLGAGPWQVFWRVTFPQIRPAVLAASMLVFLFTFTSFGVVLILGGPE
ncbi:MAG TPA: ABC transporter permease subunit, partial [Dehalococcoidia bacterium]|nr:ABC transporter permease subunit [Dehalococcoidia bacterium]